MDKLVEKLSGDTPKTKRKPGKKMSDEERAAKSFREIINMLAQFMRTDFGGTSDKVAVCAAKAKAWAIGDGSTFTPIGLKKLGAFGLHLSEDQMRGCRDRTRTNVEEIKRRIAMLETAIERLHDGNQDDALRLLTQAVGGSDALAVASIF